MPYLVEEAKLIIQNLLTFLQHKYGNNVLLYFTEEAKEDAKDDK